MSNSLWHHEPQHARPPCPSPTPGSSLRLTSIESVMPFVYSCHLVLISSASVRSIPFLSFMAPIFAWNVPWVSHIFLKRSLVFPILVFSSISYIYHCRRLSYLSLLYFGTLHSNEYIFPFLLCFLLLFFSQLFVRPPQTAILFFCVAFSWGWSWFNSFCFC